MLWGERVKKIVINKDLFVEVYIITIVVMKTLGIDSTDAIYGILSLIMLIILAFRLLNQTYKRIYFEYISLFALISVLTYFQSHRTTAVMIVASIVGMSCVKNADKIIRHTAFVWALMVPMRIVLALYGFIDKQEQTLWGFNESIGTAYGLGFGHKNQLAVAATIAVLSYIYLKKEKVKLIEVIALCSANIYINYYYAKSDFGVLVNALIFLGWIMTKNKNTRTIFIKSVKYVWIIVLIVSFTLPLMYGKIGFVSLLDTILSTRIRLSRRYLLEAGISLFGQDLTFLNQFIAIDNAYLTCFCYFGVLFSVIFYVLYYRMIVHLEKKMMVYELYIVFVFIALGYVEGSFVNPFMNYTILFIGVFLKDEYDLKKKTPCLAENIVTTGKGKRGNSL